MSKIIYCPENKPCTTCKHGLLQKSGTMHPEYKCDQGHNKPTGVCNEPDVANLADLDFKVLQEMEEQFNKRDSLGLKIDLGDLVELELEMERRCNV